MHTLIDKTVRELARDYFNGHLSFDDYRDKRRRLVDQLTGYGAEEAEASIIPEVAETLPASDPPPSAAAEQRVSDNRRFPLPMILLLLIGGLGAAGWLLFSGEGEAPPEPTTHSTGKPAAQLPMETDQVMQLVSDFIQADDWSNDALASFVLTWSALETAEHERARAAARFRPLVEGLRAEILEQRALGDMEPTEGREALLMSFAEHLGVLGLLADLQQTVIDTGGDIESMPEADHQAVEETAVAPVSDPSAAATAQVEPKQEPKPAPQVEAKPQLKPEPKPEPQVETKLQPKPEPTPEPVVEAKPHPKPEPMPAPVVEAKPQQKPESQVEAKPQPKPVPKPEPPVEPKPAPKPEPQVKKASQPEKIVETARVDPTPAQTALLKSSEDPCPASLLRTRRPVCRDSLPDNKFGPVLVVLPAGGFRMGSTGEDQEQPVHQVNIDRPFAISAYEISTANYQHFCRASGADCPVAHWNRGNDPMTNVSWNDARAYVVWLSRVTGAVYRLPSEAEWEYAARAGTTTDYPFSEGDKILLSDARFNTHSPLPVNDRSVNANRFRLRHILGNVREWVADVWQANYRGAPSDGSARLQPDTGKRVVRGGSYADDASRLRSAARSGLPADTRDRLTGFRVVREIHN